MEGLLILIAIYVLPVIVKKVIESQKKKSEPPRDTRRETSSDASSQPRRQGNLQDLIRQFEEAQRQAAQGNVEPPVPPVDEYSENYDDDEDESYNEEDEEVDLPVVTPANPNRITFREIAESVIQWEEVCVEYLQQAFGFSESTAQQVLTELQAHRIVGRDMGEGYCDLLVHDKVELDNLFKREQRDEEERQAASAQESALQARRDAELQHQKELAELEERARQLREQAGQINDGSESIGAPCPTAEHSRHARSFNKAEIRRGFVWAKVLDEPRFKKKWNSRVR